jgi:hypothetical protein
MIMHNGLEGEEWMILEQEGKNKHYLPDEVSFPLQLLGSPRIWNKYNFDN